MELKSLNQRIIKSGLKKNKIAEKIGIHRVHLSRIINGNIRKPNPLIISRIKKVLENIR